MRTLEEIERFNLSLGDIDGLLKNQMIYQASIKIHQLNIDLDALDTKLKETANVKYIFEMQKQKKNELYSIVQNYYKMFLFTFEKPLIYQISLNKNEIKKLFSGGEHFNIKAQIEGKGIQENNLNNILIKEFDVNLNDYKHLETKYNEFKNIFCSTKILKSKSSSKKRELINNLLDASKLQNYIRNFILFYLIFLKNERFAL